MPVDAIKIDRSFVAQLWPDDPAMVLVQGLIEIARQLNVHVVAEGIETEVQASQLWTMGCRSEEHTSELQSLMRISYAVFCLKKKTEKTSGRNGHEQYQVK